MQVLRKKRHGTLSIQFVPLLSRNELRIQVCAELIHSNAFSTPCLPEQEANSGFRDWIPHLSNQVLHHISTALMTLLVRPCCYLKRLPNALAPECLSFVADFPSRCGNLLRSGFAILFEQTVEELDGNHRCESSVFQLSSEFPWQPFKAPSKKHAPELAMFFGYITNGPYCRVCGVFMDPYDCNLLASPKERGARPLSDHGVFFTPRFEPTGFQVSIYSRFQTIVVHRHFPFFPLLQVPLYPMKISPYHAPSINLLDSYTTHHLLDPGSSHPPRPAHSHSNARPHT